MTGAHLPFMHVWKPNCCHFAPRAFCASYDGMEGQERDYKIVLQQKILSPTLNDWQVAWTSSQSRWCNSMTKVQSLSTCMRR